MTNPFGPAGEAYGEGHLAPPDSLADALLLDALRRYKRQVAKRYRALPPEQAGDLLPEGPLWVSTKIDGQLFFLVKRGDEAALCAHNGRVLRGLPWIDTLAAGIPHGQAIVAGELSVAGEGRARVAQVAAVLGDASRSGELAFHAFDLVEAGSTDLVALSWPERWQLLTEWFPAERLVAQEEIAREDVPRLYREWVLAGTYEGLVVRSERGFAWKVKPVVDLDLVVVAYGARITGAQRELREMTLAARVDDQTWQVVGTVGSGFSDQERLTWHHRLEQVEVPSALRLANGEGTLCRFVRPEIVVAVTCTDLLTSDGHDRPIRRPRLVFDCESGWRPTGERHTAVLLHPRFDRERNDKTTDIGDVGLEQVTRHVTLEVDRAATGGARQPATVLERAVFTKTTKGVVAVRKYLLVATNKSIEEGFSPFALFSTDYSPSRKDPLKTEVTVAGSRELADQQVAEWRTANIKRGWKEV